MTKPTSRCIDIRQEHPLLEKFKEWFMKKWNMIDSDVNYFGEWLDTHYTKDTITLDQRRERRGREYFEGQIQPKHSANSFTAEEQDDVETPEEKTLENVLDKEKVFGWLSEKGYGAEFGYKLHGFIKDFNLLKE